MTRSGSKAFAFSRMPVLLMLFPMDTKFHRRSMQRLKRTYVEGRYSDHYEITEEELTYSGGGGGETEGFGGRDLSGKIGRVN
ncbi:hypothetical protein P4S72_08655 [Vibrio sp. PP-XX7]